MDKTQQMSISNAWGRELLKEVTETNSRSSFFQALGRLFKQQFLFDRLCINLYDNNSEMLTYFTAAEGTVINSLSPVRKAEKITVAGHVIATHKPVVITDIAQHFTESSLHPMAEAGLTTTMAFPLMLNNKILGTLHCSFVRKPLNLYHIVELVLELCPCISVCLGAILAIEQLNEGATLNPLNTNFHVPGYEIFLFESKVMQEFMNKVKTIAKLDIPILLLGETGIGKTHLAHYIHFNSKRKKQTFVKINCPALAPTLFESELFGHTKGSFTGAATKRVGRLELAHNGTLFLDEIAELSVEMQSKLLHFLDDGHFERVGESVSLSVDTRLIAATNINVRQAVNTGNLRSDLYYRLSACTLELPPLRERIEDIQILSNYFINQLSMLHGLPKLHLSPSVITKLQGHSWRGNIRELRNVINHLLLQNFLAGKLKDSDVEQVLKGESLHEQGQVIAQARIQPKLQNVSSTNIHELERQHILEMLSNTNGVISGPKGAAALLGLPRSTLQHRMKKLGIDPKAPER